MNKAEIEREIRKYIVDTFLFGSTDELHDGDLLFGNIIDSTGALELVGFLQKHFDITVRDEEVIPDNLGSVRNLTTFVEAKLQCKA